MCIYLLDAAAASTTEKRLLSILGLRYTLDITSVASYDEWRVMIDHAK